MRLGRRAGGYIFELGLRRRICTALCPRPRGFCLGYRSAAVIDIVQRVVHYVLYAVATITRYLIFCVYGLPGFRLRCYEHRTIAQRSDMETCEVRRTGLLPPNSNLTISAHPASTFPWPIMEPSL